MPRKSLSRRAIAAAGIVLLTAGATAIAALPAQAAAPEVQLSVSSSTVHPGDTVTVTETVTNVNPFTVLHPAARLFSKPDTLTSYTSLVSCSGPGGTTCSTVNDGSGPIGYQAVLPDALDQNGLPGDSATVTFTLRISADAPDLAETLRGQLLGSNYGSDVIDGPTLTVDANADAAVSVSATPKFGLLVSRLDFAVKVSNSGPGVLRNAKITTTLPPGLSATASGSCAPAPGKVVCTVAQLAKGANTTANFSVPLSLLNIGLPYTFTSTRTSSDSRDLNPANDSDSTTCTVVTPLLVTCS